VDDGATTPQPKPFIPVHRWLRFLTTPKGSTTRVERGGFTDNGTFWIHGPAGTWNALSNAQTLPVADAKFVAAGNGGSDGGAAYVAMSFDGSGGTAGFRGMSSRGTPASPSASQSGDLLTFVGGHGYGASAFSAGSKVLFGGWAAQNWTDSNQGTYATVEVTPLGSTTRGEVARFDNSRTSFLRPARLQGYTVATLPAGTIGDTAYVTDALAPVFGAAVAGGGAVMVPVYYTGAAWFVG
jgi:hypothetical protein